MLCCCGYCTRLVLRVIIFVSSLCVGCERVSDSFFELGHCYHISENENQIWILRDESGSLPLSCI
jgi:hypothetical protein